MTDITLDVSKKVATKELKDFAEKLESSGVEFVVAWVQFDDYDNIKLIELEAYE